MHERAVSIWNCFSITQTNRLDTPRILLLLTSFLRRLTVPSKYFQEILSYPLVRPRYHLDSCCGWHLVLNYPCFLWHLLKQSVVYGNVFLFWKSAYWISLFLFADVHSLAFRNMHRTDLTVTMSQYKSKKKAKMFNKIVNDECQVKKHDAATEYSFAGSHYQLHNLRSLTNAFFLIESSIYAKFTSQVRNPSVDGHFRAPHENWPFPSTSSASVLHLIATFTPCDKRKDVRFPPLRHLQHWTYLLTYCCYRKCKK